MDDIQTKRFKVSGTYVPTGIRMDDELPTETKENKTARLARNVVALETLKPRSVNELGPIARAQLGLSPLTEAERRKRRKTTKALVPPELDDALGNEYDYEEGA